MKSGVCARSLSERNSELRRICWQQVDFGSAANRLTISQKRDRTLPISGDMFWGWRRSGRHGEVAEGEATCNTISYSSRG